MNIDTTLSVMNKAYDEDKNAIHALISNKVPCNMKLAGDPHIITNENPEVKMNYLIGVLGVINGLLLAHGNIEVIAARFDETADKRFLGFVKVPYESHKIA